MESFHKLGLGCSYLPLSCIQYQATDCVIIFVFVQPVVTSQLGTINNILNVKKTDFEVFDALMVDSQKSSDVSGMKRPAINASYCNAH